MIMLNAMTKLAGNCSIGLVDRNVQSVVDGNISARQQWLAISEQFSIIEKKPK